MQLNQTIAPVSQVGAGLNAIAERLKQVIEPVSRIINSIGVAILVAMMLLTAADVVLRYAFRKPITGSLELTQFMMAILVAFSLAYTGTRKSHISINVITEHLSPGVRAVLNTATSILSLGIYALISWQSILNANYLRTGGFTSSVLYIPQAPFMYIFSFGTIMLCLVYLYRLFENLAVLMSGTRLWLGLLTLLISLAIVAVVAIPVWEQGLRGLVSPVVTGLISIIVLIIILFSEMPIADGMALLGFLGMAYLIGLERGLINLGTAPYTTASSYNLSVIPLFVVMGLFCFYSGISKDLYHTMYKWMGKLPGGLAMATIGACAGFAAVSGSSAATTATMGTVSLPEMKKRRYDASLATGCISSGGCLGILIPPSITMVIYGVLTEQSIGKLFLAGFLPGILEALLFMMAIYIICKRNPLLGPPGEGASLKEKIVSLKGTWSILLLFVLVIGGMYAGVFTVTEAAGVGAFGAFIIALGRRKLTRKQFIKSLLETGETTAMMLAIMIGAIILGYFLAVTRLPSELASYITSIAVNRYIILGAILLLYLFLGCIMAAAAMVVLTVPIFFPLIVALGFDPIWFGIVIVVMVEIGQITPPVGINVFIIQNIARDVPMYSIFRGIVPFFFAALAETALLVIFPQIATIVPSMMK